MIKYLLVFLFLFHLSYGQDEWNDGFSEWDDQSEEAFSEIEEDSACENHSQGPSSEKIAAVAFSILAIMFSGVAVRFKKMHVFRPIVLICSIGFLGFYLGGCPCPIKGFESIASVLTGNHIHKIPLILLGSVILLTIFLGPVWCGWVCHLGGLQEFIYRKGLFPQPSPKVNKIFIWIRRVIGISFLVTLVWTSKSFWEPIDPFRSVFNLLILNPTSWILVFLLIFSSLFISRPFCRIFCPVGFVLGEVNRLPFVSKIRATSTCIHCKKCSDVCGTGAMEKGKIIYENCIACGDCMGACKRDGLNWKLSK